MGPVIVGLKSRLFLFNLRGVAQSKARLLSSNMTLEKFVGIFTTDANLITVSWDEWLAQATAITPDAAQGQSLTKLFPDLEKRGLLERFQRVLTEGVVEVLAPAFHHYLFACPPVVPSKHFDRMQQRVTIAPLSEGHVVIGTFVTIEDVTARLDRERELVAQLESRDEAARFNAARMLAEQDEIHSAQPLIGVLGDQSWRVRKLAVDGLARHGGDDAVKSLMRVLRQEHRNLGVLNSALQVLALSGLDAIGPLVECLSDGDSDLRIYAAHALGDQHDPRAVSALIGAFDDPDPNVRYHAIEALGKLRAADAVDKLAAIAESRDFYLAFAALDALMRIGDPRIAPRLVPLLQDEMLRVPCADALGRLGDEDTIAPLITLLNEQGAPVQAVAQSLAALHDRYERLYSEGDYIAGLARRDINADGEQNLLKALNNINDDGLRALVLVLGWLEGDEVARALTTLLGIATARKEVVEALVRYGERVTELLTGQLGSEDVETRQAAIVALGRIGDPRSVPALLQILSADDESVIGAAGALAKIGDRRSLDRLLDLVGHPKPAVRQAVIAAINSIGHPEMASRTAKLLTDPDPYIRESAVQIAGYFGYEGCIEPLFERCVDEDESVRRTAIEHIPYLDDDRVTSILVEALQDKTSRVRASAAKALGQVETSRAAPYLLLALKDDDPWVRYFAARSIGRYDYAESLDALARLAEEDPVHHVRIAAVESLARIGGEQATAVLARLTRSDNVDLASAAIEGLGRMDHTDSLSPLLAALRAGDAVRRRKAAQALGRRGESSVVQALQWTAAAETDADVRKAAVDSLARLATPEAIDTLIALSADPVRREDCVAALAEIGKERIESIAGGLAHLQTGVRCATVSVLERIKLPRASELLGAALDDMDAAVRMAAANALARLGSRGAERKLVTIARTDSDASVRRAAQKALRK